MINLVDITNLPSADNVFLAKIISNANMYEKFHFCNNFVQKQEEKTTAYINILSGVATIFALDNCDFEEICDFLRFQSVSQVFCNEYFAKNVEFKRVSSGTVLEFFGEIPPKSYDVLLDVDYKSVYKLLSDNFCMPDYNEFVSDLSYRLNHGFATLVKSESGVAFSACQTENTAVISALAVDITKRNIGNGSKLLNSLVHNLASKKIFVYCEEKNINFYKKNGFNIVDKYFVGKDF